MNETPWRIRQLSPCYRAAEARPRSLYGAARGTGQLKFLAERGDGLVDRKAGRIGRDLEKHTARFPEIHRPEVLPIQLRRVLQAVVLLKLARHRRLCRVIGRAESDMVDRTAAHLSCKEFLGHADVDDASEAPRRAKANIWIFTADLLEPQHIA